MEEIIADQQARITELEGFLMWIHEVTSEGPPGSSIPVAIENFNSKQSMKSKAGPDQTDREGESPRNLTFFPLSYASSVNNDQGSSMQSVPLH